jgi:hypothetical protein
MVNGEDLAPRPGKVAPAKLQLAKGFKPLEKRNRSGEVLECRMSQLDPVPQDEVVADQCVELFTDLRTEYLVMLYTIERTAKIPVCNGEGLEVVEMKERRQPALVGPLASVWGVLHDEKNGQRKKKYGP